MKAKVAGSSLGADGSPRTAAPSTAALRALRGAAVLAARTFLAAVQETPVLGSRSSRPPERGVAYVPARTLDLGNVVLVEFDLFLDTLRVDGAAIQVELGRSEEGFVPVKVRGTFEPGIALGGLASPSPSVVASLDGAPKELVARRGEDGLYRPAFVVTRRGRRDTVDAVTGELLSSLDLSCSGSAEGLVSTRNPTETPRAPLPLPDLTITQGSSEVATASDGTFPLTGSVALTEGMAGPLCRVVVSELSYAANPFGTPVVDASDTLSYSGPADFTLAPTELTTHQDEVSAFWNVMDFNAYVRATYPVLASAASDRVAVDLGVNEAFAFFTPGPVTWGSDTFFGELSLGTNTVAPGDVRHMACDATVVRHEYTHFLLYHYVPQLITLPVNGIPLNEAIADYLSCVQFEDPRWGEYSGPDPMTLPPSTSVGGFFRDLSGSLVYPQDQGTPQYPSGEVHRVGNIWGQAFWEARTNADARTPGDRLRIDQAILQGYLRLPAVPSWADLIACIIDADAALNDGANATILETAFNDHGLGPAPAVNPPAVTVSRSVSATAGQPLSITVVVRSQGTDPVTLTASSPTLPLAFTTTAGITAIGTLTGTPSAPGVFAVTVVATSRTGSVAATVSVTVVAPAPPAPGPLSITLATSATSAIAPLSIASAYGANLATGTASGSAAPGAPLLGTSVTVTDASGVTLPATLFFVSPSQVNFLVPQAASGAATVTVTSGSGAVSRGTVTVASVVPGLFSADGSGGGPAAAVVLRVRQDGTRSYADAATVDASGRATLVPIDLGVAAGDQVFLELYGTGFRGSASPATVTIGGVPVTVTFSGAQGGDPGLDQADVLLPASLAGSGTISVVLSASGVTANVVQIAVE